MCGTWTTIRTRALVTDATALVVGDKVNLDVLEEFCCQAFGPGKVTNLRKLSGGASMESWRFDLGTQDCILRLRPGGSRDHPSDSEVALVSLSGQAQIIGATHSAHIKVPEILAELPRGHALGEGFIMACVPGEALPSRILRKPEFDTARGALSQQCAAELAKIHATPTEALETCLVRRTPDQLLTEQHQFYQAMGSPTPVFELAFAWLRTHCPAVEQFTLVHGDFRIGNLLVTPEEGLTSILDWELAHLGDPMRDISFICTPSWRFGNYELEAGGFATREQWLTDYEQASGRAINRDIFHWWLVFNTLWWGVTCLRFGSAFKDGSLRTVERAVIGRRVTEVEIDLLLQLNNSTGLGLDHSSPCVAPSSSAAVNHVDVSQGLLEWINDHILPASEGHQTFEARVAANAMGIVTRALSMKSEFDQRYASRLSCLGETEATLLDKLRATVPSDIDVSVWSHLMLSALEKIDIDQPGYAGAVVARKRWLAH